MKNFILKNNGITLISLIITIIIMLILAGVSLSFLNGEYGVVTQAIQGKEATEAAQKREKEELRGLSGDATNRIKRTNPSYVAPSPSTPSEPEVNNPEESTPEVPNLSFNTTVPENGTYYVGVTSNKLGEYTGYTAVYNSNEGFPETVNVGDVFVFQDYEYRYGKYCTGTSWTDTYYASPAKDWGAKVLTTTKERYTNPLASINNKPVNNFGYTWSYCSNLIEAPVLPEATGNLHWAFISCSSLEVAPVLPDSVFSISTIFAGCSNLRTYAGSTDPDGDFSNYKIPVGLTSINSAFKSCLKMTVAPYIPENVTDMQYAFYSPPKSPPLTGYLHVPCGVSENNLYWSYYQECDVEIVRYCRSSCKGCTFCHTNCGH